MLRLTLLAIVALIVTAAFGLAWLSRNERLGFFTFGGVGVVGTTLFARTLYQGGDSAIWPLALYALLGSLAAIWGLAMASLITRGINSMVVRDFETDQEFSLSGGARVARVGSMTLRQQSIEPGTNGSFNVALSVTTLNDQDALKDIVLTKNANEASIPVDVDGFRVQVLDVAKSGNKASLYAATVIVTKPDDDA